VRVLSRWIPSFVFGVLNIGSHRVKDTIHFRTA
jgi:hypothetical protein